MFQLQTYKQAIYLISSKKYIIWWHLRDSATTAKRHGSKDTKRKSQCVKRPPSRTAAKFYCRALSGGRYEEAGSPVHFSNVISFR